MRMTDKLLRAKQALAFKAFDAAGRGRGVGLRQQDATACAEAGVLHAEAERRRLGVEPGHGGQRGRPVQESAAQSFGVTLSYKSALCSCHGNDAGLFQFDQLFKGARRAEDLELVAGRVYLRQGDVLEDAVEDLRQTKTSFATNDVTGNVATSQPRFFEVTLTSVARHKDGSTR